MVAVSLPVVVAAIAAAYGVGFITPRPARPLGELPLKAVLDLADTIEDNDSVDCVDHIEPARRAATGLHCVEYSDLQESRTLYEGPSEVDARTAWESIALQHPAPAGTMTWWKPDGGLRGAWGSIGAAR